MNDYHETVMASEAIDGLHVEKGGKYIDATAGNGGHMEAILAEGGKVLGIDLDPRMLEIAEKRLKKAYPTLNKDSGDFKLIYGNFTDMARIAREEEWIPVSGILFDLGVTNIHLKDQGRGFSFENPEAPLDMRIDPDSQGVTGADLLNVLREDQLRDLFEITLEPGAAKWITGRVLHSREKSPVKTVGDVLEISRGLKSGKPSLNEATLPFLAIRIAVNSELANLKDALPQAFDLLDKGGRLVVISFHSKEDAIVKDFFKEKSISDGAKIITHKPVRADASETEANRRARSAKMRILEK
ncbi:MAG TPA: 16S rRNA (cytosine(1402)-N(4))-methyltransferase RsmH [Patescibacteria group bacterium]|nr:16S rRNA (cytosine(1402)-N(4))-methyltransferase RsmH [Patescibacteria group bacterium]